MAQSLVDGYGRRIDYLRISVTDRCNFRCIHCMPAGGVPAISHDEILRYEEIVRVVGEARSLGFKRFRITGGEPLVRRGIILLLEKLSGEDIEYSMTTNGVFLRQYAAPLKRAGLRRVNVGLNTLRDETFRRITRVGEGLRDVLRGIDAVREAGIPSVKINVVVMKGINDSEIDDFLSWSRREVLDIRFIEFMPVHGEDLFVSLKGLSSYLKSRDDLIPFRKEGGGPAISFRYPDGRSSIGCIMARSEPFCGDCNRLRLTADGRLLPCLFSSEGMDLRKPLKGGADIRQLIIKAVGAKPEGHMLDMRLPCRAMSLVGG